ncbi:hypothetical protein JW926_14820 [Candidatus Sumerlaeota bacterium]|nr:hypothetical protein [Candidatus Sumerlaeota bacterium]
MKKPYVIVLLILGIPLFIHADRILLRNGQTIKGRIREKTDQRIMIENPTGAFSLHLEDVKKIEEDAPSRNSLYDAEIALAKKNAPSALESYRNALSEGLDFTHFTQHFLNQFPQWEALFEEQTGYQKDRIGLDILQIMEIASMGAAVDSATTDTLEFYFASAKVLAQTTHTQKAMEIFAMLPNRFYAAFPEKRTFAVKFLKSQAALKMNHGDFNEALLALENLETLDYREGKKSRILVFLRWGAQLRDQKQWRDAALIYSQKVAPLSGEIASNRIVYLLELMEREAKIAADYVDIIKLTGEFSPFLPDSARGDSETKRLEELYIKAGEIALGDNATTQASSLFREGFIASKRKNARLFDLYQYAQTLLRLEPDDFAGHYELAVSCRKKGFLEKAHSHFRISFLDPRLKEAAEREIELMRKRSHLDALQKAVKFYDAQDFTKALDTLQPLFHDNPSTDVLKEVVRLDEICRTQLENESNKRPIRALIQYQQAERLFLLEEYDNALDRINYILETYPDTPIAPRARDLMITVLRRREMARLEKLDETGVEPRAFPNMRKNQSPINEEINKLVDSLNDE